MESEPGISGCQPPRDSKSPLTGAPVEEISEKGPNRASRVNGRRLNRIRIRRSSADWMSAGSPPKMSVLRSLSKEARYVWCGCVSVVSRALLLQGTQTARLKLLADDFSFNGPMLAGEQQGGVPGRLGLGPIVRGCDIRRQWVDGDDVCSIYDFKIETPAGAGSIPMAEWSVVRGGKLAVFPVAVRHCRHGRR